MNNFKAYTLNVKYGEQCVGSLVLNQNTNLLNLHYAPHWQMQGFAISPALPLNNQHSAEAAYNYLDNALPEGEARKLLAQNLGISEKNIYSQVRALGNDLAGALTFCDDAVEQEKNTPILRVLEEPELIARLECKDELGLITWDEKPRLSVAGVQDKLNLFVDPKGHFGFGDGSLCSTHIVKFEKTNCLNLVINEYFCMQLSAALGLPTADVEFMRFGKHPALMVKRFDRKYNSETQKVMKRHVIDACQALNLPRDNKYERNFGDGRDVKHIRDGASLQRLFEFCQTMSSPVASQLWLINWQLFNLMINNFDSHGKNVSLFYDNKGSQFTPAYDLVNVSMFPQFRHVLAMAMGDEFEPEAIHAYQLADFAETCNIDKKLLTRQLTSLADKVIMALESNEILQRMTADGRFTTQELAYLKAVSQNITARTEHLRSQAADISSIEV